MEGFSIISYKDKTIYYFDYSGIGNSKEKVVQVLEYYTRKYQDLPLKSLLVLVNVTNLHLDSDLVSAFRASREETAPYEKKVAAFGMRGMQRLAYNFVASLDKEDLMKAFDSELEAKEWLILD
jgi:hypothetical protein